MKEVKGGEEKCNERRGTKRRENEKRGNERKYDRRGERRGDGVKEEERLKHFTLLIPIYGAIKRAIS